MNADWLKISSEIEAIAIDFRLREAEIPCEQRIELCMRLASIRRLIDRLAQSPLSPIKEGGVREAILEAAKRITQLAQHVSFHETPRFSKTVGIIISEEFAGFVPREEVERWKDEARLQKMACEAVEGAHRELSETLNLVGSQIEAGADDCIRECARADAAQAQNAQLQADNAKLRELLLEVDEELERDSAVSLSLQYRVRAALQSSRAGWIVESATPGATFKVNIDHKRRTIVVSLLTIAPSPWAPKSEAQERGAPFDEERTKEKP